MLPGAVRLTNGRHFGPNSGFGVAHIIAEHADEISGTRLTPEQFVHETINTADQIWQQSDGRLIFFRTGKRQRMSVVELRNDGDFYSVITAFIPNKSKQDTLSQQRQDGTLKLVARDRRPSRVGNQQANLPEPLAGSRNATLNPVLEPLTGQTNSTILSQNSALRQSTQYTNPTIEVDGITRPTTNSAGNPIHSTEAGIRNFWAWFGDSKIVDEQGRPLVVYHGSRSTEALTEFVVSQSEPSDTRLKRTKDGAYFTRNPDKAAVYAGQDGSTYPVYLNHFT